MQHSYSFELFFSLLCLSILVKSWWHIVWERRLLVEISGVSEVFSERLLRAGGMLDILAAVSGREDPRGYVLGISCVVGYHRCSHGDPFGVVGAMELACVLRTSSLSLSTTTTVSLQSSFLLPLSLQLSLNLSLSV